MSNSIAKTLSLDFESKLHIDFASQIPSPNFELSQADFFNKIISSCRGFIFLRQSSKFHLWNPCTGAHKQVPLSPNELNVDNFSYLYGFGYDQFRDDYLVVLVSFDTTVYHEVNSCLEFFSLRDNIWREIEGTHFPYYNNTWNDCSPRVGLLFNGFIHWLAAKLVVDEENSDNVILAFDLTERKLLEMPYPNDFDCELKDDCALWVFGEYFSLWVSDYFNFRVEIWVMKEYKVHSSWTKALVFPIYDISTRYFYPICSTKSYDIVGTSGDCTVLQKYNGEGLLLEQDSCYEGLLISQMTVYTESLLSLPGDNVHV
jgi:F-box interacting protein